jgi:hypothetical protein
MKLWNIYHSEMPDFIREMAATDRMQRLDSVGMNCGCEYTSFPIFNNIEPYSRYEHSVGVGLIVWHFTGDVQQAVAALLHDISTPVFSHVVDFMNGDHVRQESTESQTTAMISSSPALQECLRRTGLQTCDVDDYHRFPVADNDTPRLSADRLEYTLGNVVNYGVGSRETVAAWYSNLVVGCNEEGADELMFSDLQTAEAFALAAIQMSHIYVSDEDRFSMQMLAELMAKHICRGVLSEVDLYTTEPQVIELLLRDPDAAADWQRYRAYHKMITPNEQGTSHIIPAKKRYIDPYVQGRGRVSKLSPAFAEKLQQFLDISFDEPVMGV